MPTPSASAVQIVVGLGNPGAEFAHTRHNVGFATVDVLAEEAGVRYWKSEEGCLTAEARVGGADVLLAKPGDFMNTSGGPVSKLCRAHHVAPAHLLVVHDEVDLPEGTVRARFGGGLNAHNGLRSIRAKLGTADFGRLRVGIGRPPGRMDVATYVLRELKGRYLEEFELTCADAATVVRRLLAGELAWELPGGRRG